MKKIVALAILTLFYCNPKVETSANDPIKTTTYYLIRHAEKDRSNSLEKNPKLIEEGKKRAQKWSQVFKNIAFDAVYSTNYARTKETALPTAIKNNLETKLYHPNTMDYELFKKQTKGQTVLVVGHSNTTPAFVNKLLNKKKYKDIEDSNNANLYVVSIINNMVSDQVLYVN